MRLRVGVSIAVMLLMGGCGSEGPAPSEPDEASPGPEPTATPSTKGQQVISGVVAEGAERGCLQLATAGAGRQVWTLVGARAGITVGDRVTVRGRPAPDLATRCQEGTPFVVEAVGPG